MRRLRGLGLFAILLVASFAGRYAHALPTQSGCAQGMTIPSGWVITQSKWDPGCPGAAAAFAVNWYTITNVSNQPVNTTIGACQTTGWPIVPPGWSQVGQTASNGACGCPYAQPPGCVGPDWQTSDMLVLQHTTCMASGPGACPAATGTLSASPTSVVIPYGVVHGTTNLTFNAQNTTGTCIWTSTNGAAAGLWSCNGASGNASWPYLTAGSSTKFILTTSNTAPSPVLAQVTVSATAGARPTMSANPAAVVVPYGAANAATTITWNAPGYSLIDWCGKIGSGAWSYSGLQTGGSGSTGTPMPPNTTYGYRLYAHGAATGCPSTGILASLTVTSTQGAQPTMSATPSTVVVPYGAQDAPSTIAWNAPGYSSVDWCGKINNGAWSFGGLQTGGSGSTVQPVPVNTTYAYRLYAHGAAAGCPSTGILASTTVTAVQGAQPTFSINPSHVIVPLGQTSGTFTMTWNAPGYPSLDLWGKINNGPWQFGLQIPANSSTGSPIDVGTTYGYRFYPPGDSSHLLGELSVTASH